MRNLLSRGLSDAAWLWPSSAVGAILSVTLRETETCYVSISLQETDEHRSSRR